MTLSKSERRLMVMALQSWVRALSSDMSQYPAESGPRANMMHDIKVSMDIITALENSTHVVIRGPATPTSSTQEHDKHNSIDLFNNWDPNDPRNW